MEYGKAFFDSGQRTEALHIFLRLLVRKPNHAEAREQIAKIIGAEGGTELVTLAFLLLLPWLKWTKLLSSPPQVIEELSGLPSSMAAALAYLATVIKNYGGECARERFVPTLSHAHLSFLPAVNESAQLYAKALELTPQSSTYILNLLHGFEVNRLPTRPGD